ncbi:MAG: hypothetical protein ACEY3J_03105 [Arsenophonus sp.]
MVTIMMMNLYRKPTTTPKITVGLLASKELPYTLAKRYGIP